MNRKEVSVRETSAGGGGVFMMVTGPGDGADKIYREIGRRLADKGLAPVHERIFGSLSSATAVLESRRRALTAAGLDADTPVNYIEGAPPEGEGMAGVILQAVPADTKGLRTVRSEGAPVGRTWETGAASYLIVQNIDGGGDGTREAEAQTAEMIRRLEGIVNTAGFRYSDVIRTWFYLNDILDWYNDFNRARNREYARIGIMPEAGQTLLLPASTGIGGRHPRGTAAVTDLLAVKHREPDALKRLSNPGQKEAFAYGSAFSRASLIPERDANIIHVSGTAAIDEAGATLHLGDYAKQIECTLDKLETLLGGVGATLRHAATASVFVKQGEAVKLFDEIAASRGLDLPGVAVVADVCRDDLLFEIDAEVVVPIAGATGRSGR